MSTNNLETNYELENDLGDFEGFNFRSQSAIMKNQSAEEVVNWDHDKLGEAEFWPSGEHSGVMLVFNSQSSVCSSEILALDSLISELGDKIESYIKIAWMLEQGNCITKLTSEEITDEPLYIFSATSFIDTYKEAAYELFEAYYPEEYRIWERSTCPGLYFDHERFLSGPEFSTSEFSAGDEKFLVVQAA